MTRFSRDERGLLAVLEIVADVLVVHIAGGPADAVLWPRVARAFRAEVIAHATIEPPHPDQPSPELVSRMWADVAGRDPLVLTEQPPDESELHVLAIDLVWADSRTRRAIQNRFPELVLTDAVIVAPDLPSLICLGCSCGLTPDQTRMLHTIHPVLGVLGALTRRTGPGSEHLQPHQATMPRALSGRELEVLRFLSEGLLARTIAQRMEVSERTVHKHLGSVYRKLQVHDRLLAVQRGQHLGLVPVVPRPRAAADEETTVEEPS